MIPTTDRLERGEDEKKNHCRDIDYYGLAIMSAPLLMERQRRNEQMVQEIEQIIEQETENEEKEDNGDSTRSRH